eukprot:gene33806-39413_t
MHLDRLIVALAMSAAIAGAASAAETPTFSERLQALVNKIEGKQTLKDIARSNGRLEAEQVLVSAKIAGRVTEVLVSEGQTVDAGEVIARMDDTDLKAQMAGALAQ